MKKIEWTAYLQHHKYIYRSNLRRMLANGYDTDTAEYLARNDTAVDCGDYWQLDYEA